MDSELTELDDWVGTLEELQLGLERKCPSASASNRLKPKSSYSGPHHLTRAPTSSPSPWRVAQILDSPPPPPLPPGRDSRLSPPALPQSPPERPPRSRCDESSRRAFETCRTNSLTQSIRASFNPLSCQDATVEEHFLTLREATAENDLNCLLRHLEEVENTMRQLEQDDGGFTRRYSLASSSTTDPNTGCNPSPAPDTPEQSYVVPETPPPAGLNTDTAVSGGVPSDQQGTLQLPTKPALPPRRFYQRTPSPQNTDYELTDDASTAAFLSSPPDLNGSLNPSVTSASPGPVPARVVPHDGGLINKTAITEVPELSKKINQVVDLADRLQLNKLVVRIFRPDKTTKAILIDQSMTAGEVASMLVEKNFLEPSIKLCLVEKVPSLKVERVFEESENVAECILSWPIKSQNMIFFESRDDHFGFIESPKDWLGESFASIHGFHSNDSLQNMLDNFASSGLAEWHDFLYIRKPGEKTWARRMCVLRNSGLYATKKSKKSFSATDLIRLLVMDDKLHVYTTTGGWSRMRAPTPHGFALKTYAAQEFNSTHVFCFCAPDEMALRQWVCRLRLAKYGTGLLQDYQTAKDRVSGGHEGQIVKATPDLKKLARNSSLEHARSAMDNAFQTPQLLTRRQASAGNLNTTKYTPPIPQQRVASLTPQPNPSTIFKNPFDPSLQNGGYKHHSIGAQSQHVYIR